MVGELRSARRVQHLSLSSVRSVSGSVMRGRFLTLRGSNGIPNRYSTQTPHQASNSACPAWPFLTSLTCHALAGRHSDSLLLRPPPSRLLQPLSLACLLTISSVSPSPPRLLKQPCPGLRLLSCISPAHPAHMTRAMLLCQRGSDPASPLLQTFGGSRGLEDATLFTLSCLLGPHPSGSSLPLGARQWSSLARGSPSWGSHTRHHACPPCSSGSRCPIREDFSSLLKPSQ